jgi:AAA domain
MKIIELRASNFARLSAVEIRPDGAVVALRGKNTQGKSSILKAIWTAFVGRAAAPPHAIKDGTDEARLHVDIGDEKVELSIARTIRRDKHGGETWDLKVTQADGARVTRKPQELIDVSLDALSFDPLAFARAAPKDQLAQLKAIIPGIDFSLIEAKRAELFAERTDINRTAKAAQARAAGITLPPGPKPAAIDTAALLERLDAVNEHNQQRTRAIARHGEKLRERDRLRAEAELRRVEANRLMAISESKKQDADEIDEQIGLVQIPEVADATEITNAIAGAADVDAVRRAFDHRSTYEHEAKQAENKSNELTDAIETLDKRVRDAIAAAKLPAGLSLALDSVLLHGLPFEQAADSEKIIASAQVRMALSPDLRVMLIDRAESLDQSSMQALAQLAEANDYQVWTASVDEGEGAPGFYIEDGRVARREAAE